MHLLRPNRKRNAAVLVLVVAAVLAGVSPALAAVARAVATAGSSANAGSWGVSAVNTGGTPTAGASYVLSWPRVGPAFFEVVNTGTLQLTRTTWAARNSPPLNGVAPPEVAFDVCVNGTWNTTLNTCSGTVQRVASTVGGTFNVDSAHTAAAPGSRLVVRAGPVSITNFPNAYTTTLDLSVTRAQTRAATTTNS